MSKKDLSYYINKNVTIIQCKKRAKELFKLNKPGETKTLSQCKDLAAFELGFKNWFELQNSIKKKCLIEIANIEQQLIFDFNNLLKECLNSNATDIHIEVRQTHGKIRIRKHGELQEYKAKEEFSYDYIYDFCKTILNKISYGNKFDFYEVSQASMFYQIEQENIILRYQFVPAYPNGFDIILRLKHSNLYSNLSSLSSLGYSDSHMNQILNATSKNNGCFIVAGSAGQGKNTSIKAIANYFSKGNRKISSIENALEYPLLNKEIKQIKCIIPKEYNPQKSIYEDPIKDEISNGANLILIDDFRDKSTAKVIEESYKSALFVTTLNASHAIGIIPRLYDFGLNIKTVANPNFCQGLVYQKLMPVVCPHCSKPLSKIAKNPNHQNYIDFFDNFKQKYPLIKLDNIKIRNHDGCSKCYNGINSRTVCAEVVTLDESMLQLIENNDLKQLYLYWRGLSDNNLLSNNMTGKTVHEHALSKMLLGQIDPLDIWRHFGKIYLD